MDSTSTTINDVKWPSYQQPALRVHELQLRFLSGLEVLISPHREPNLPMIYFPPNNVGDASALEMIQYV